MKDDVEEYIAANSTFTSHNSEIDDETPNGNAPVLTEEHHVPYAINLLFEVTDHWTLELRQSDPIHLRVEGDIWFSEYDNGSKMSSPRDLALTAVVRAIQPVASGVTVSDLKRWVGGFSPARLSEPEFVQIAMERCREHIKTSLVAEAQKGGYAALLKLAEPIAA